MSVCKFAWLLSSSKLEASWKPTCVFSTPPDDEQLWQPPYNAALQVDSGLPSAPSNPAAQAHKCVPCTQPTA